MRKKIRFASLVRVSTERQAKRGESLLTQRKQIRQAVESLGGKIIREYGGQESATSTSEKRQVNKMLDDAESEPREFDAIIVAHPDRWSRDNSFSEIGLNRLEAAGIRFFVLTQEHQLDEPNDRMMLAMFTAFGSYQAKLQSKKSQENRLERSRRGIPTSGKMPFGRSFNRAKKCWEIIPEKKAMIEDIAARYIAGESLPKLCLEYGQNHQNIAEALREKCGETWIETFSVKGEKESVEHRIPALLSESVIRRIHKTAERNKKRSGPQINDYLLQGNIYCGVCGYNLSGQPVNRPEGFLYYRHPIRDRARKCHLKPRPYIRCNDIDEAVIKELFEQLGNPVGARRAIQAAIPDQKHLVKLELQLKRWQTIHEEITVKKENVKQLFIDGDIERKEKTSRLAQLIADDAEVVEQLHKIKAQLDSQPTAYRVDEATEAIQKLLANLRKKVRRKASAKPWLIANEYARDISLMTFDDKRALIQRVFDGEASDGKPRGVYVFPDPESAGKQRKAWRFKLHGLAWAPEECVTVYASQRQDKAPPAPHSPPPAVPRPDESTQSPDALGSPSRVLW